MKITEKDKELLQRLHSSDLGRDLVDYIQRLQSDICDIRNMKPGDSIESVQKAAEYLQLYLVDKITLQNDNKELDPNEYA